MPSSFSDAIPVVLGFVSALQPKSILDIGIGCGKYGMLFREYLDIIFRPEDPCPLSPGGRRVRIDGIEVYPPYITEVQRGIYDHIFVGDALTLLCRLRTYDLVFATDILEHFSAHDGQIFLREALGRSGCGLLLVTPAIPFAQEPLFGNPHEVHRSFWTLRDFAGFPHADFLVSNRQLIVYLPSDGVRRRLPRLTLRDAAGQLVHAGLSALLGERRTELFLQGFREMRS